VQARGSTPRHDGARMLVWPDGHILGTVGGGTLEEQVILHAQEALQSSRSRLEKYLLSTGGEPESLGLCGGEVLIHIEVLEPMGTLVVFGAGHVTLALAQMAALVDMRLVVVDDRPEYLTPERYPQAQRIHVPYERATETLAPVPFQFPLNAYVVVATWGWDEPALAQALAAEPPPAYVGLISSRTKWRVIREMLAKRGIPEQRLDLVHAPCGLDLGAETPGEIALAIMAEILAARRKAGGLPLAMRTSAPTKAQAG
jgi:xanthine dehydrogenase accessory factor